ncbi:aryl-alcohol dehydrogenase-like predicted oxidoreductase [Saonia flava]|uniref:Aryl-alcohol dehydrogenase-like predicted oxidoreductase n=1 Tax=Saonia flava TaxID=523696 RepID=A0A846QWP5_9FLAO|nr:aldo/keto reductase [Saonia flava]NJB71360.1 aryl-alcohol dehydrogenase-like predicted oxidoreductase [Saonia flava]
MKEEKKQVNRRSFISKSALLGAGLVASPMTFAHEKNSSKKIEGSKAASSPGKRMLGALEVSPIGLGCMSMKSGSYNPPRDKKEMIPVIRGAVDLGVTFFDTAEVYGPFIDEELVGEALAPVREQVVIASKFGFDLTSGQRGGRNSNPAYIRQAVEGMLKRLRTDRIDLLYLHRLDPNVPIEDVAGTVKDLIKEGKALHFGLSEVSPATLRKAHLEQPVAALQSEYSLIQRVLENEVIDTCGELGIGFVPWGPVCRGFLGDKFNEHSRFSSESRLSAVPYFTSEAIKAHMDVLVLVRQWARKKNATPAQISLAWLLAQKPFIVPIPGTTKLHHMKENMGAININFTKSELKEFRNDLEQINLIGVRGPETALIDQ